MKSDFSILIEKHNKGLWLKIITPPYLGDNTLLSILNNNGGVLKKISLSTGSNAIDLTQIHESVINVKIENDFKTIVKKIVLSL